MTVVATDGRRLAMVEHEMEIPKEREGELILPTKAVNELLDALHDDGPLKILTSKNQVAFQFDDVLLITKLIEGTYPNYKQVVPSESEQRIAVDRESLLTAIRRVALLTSEKSNSVKLTFAKNNLQVSTVTPEVGEARETLPVKYAGKDLTIAFNPEFLMDPLRNVTSDEVFLEFTDELSPGVIKCNVPFVYVLMPVRVT
jgi:DNA polymerase-3 subunit beta